MTDTWVGEGWRHLKPYLLTCPVVWLRESKISKCETMCFHGAFAQNQLNELHSSFVAVEWLT